MFKTNILKITTLLLIVGFVFPLSVSAYGKTFVNSVYSSLGSGVYQVGQVVPLKVNFSAPVTVTPYVWNSCSIASTTGCANTEEYPKLTLALDDGTTTAYFVTSSNGTDNLIFNYTVGVGDKTNGLDYASTSSLVYNSVDPSQVTVRDDAGDSVNLLLPSPGHGSSIFPSSIVMVGVNSLSTIFNVSSTRIDGAYKAGDSITIKIFFNQNVNVIPYKWHSYDPTRRPRWNSVQSDYPALALKMDNGTIRYATYVSGSGSNVLTYRYIVQAGDRTNDLAYSSTTSFFFRRDYLSINNPTTGAYYIEDEIGGVINDAGEDLSLLLPAVGTTGSLDKNKDIKINTSLPSLVMNGDTDQEISLGGTYVEEGATAIDELDGNLTSSIVRSGTVDVNRLGNYKITYSVTNSAGSETTGVRNIFVHNIVSGLPTANTYDRNINVIVGGGSAYLYQIDSETISNSQIIGASSTISLSNLSIGEHILRIWGKNTDDDSWQSTPYTYIWTILPTVDTTTGGIGSVSSSDVKLLSDSGIISEVASSSGKVLGAKTYQFKRILRIGSKGDDVKLLQFLLIKQNIGKSSTALAKTGITGYFGKMTENALREYTKFNKLKPSNGTLNKYIQSHFQKLGQDLKISLSKISVE